MLNEREMAMAKELAKKLAETNELDEKESYETVICAFQNIKEVFVSAWDTLKENISSIVESIERIAGGIEKKHAYNWHIPVKITPPPMPDIKMPKLQLARSNL